MKVRLPREVYLRLRRKAIVPDRKKEQARRACREFRKKGGRA